MSDLRQSLAPLPGLADALSRRRAIFGAVALAAAPVAALPALASPEAVDPIVDIYQTATALQAYAARPDISEDAADEAGEKVCDLKAEAFELGATTPAGALASLLWAREEFSRYYVDIKDPDWMNRWTLAMIDNAIGVLRSEVAHV